MKYLGALILVFLLSTTSSFAAEDIKYIQLPSNKNIRVLLHGNVEVPESMGFGKTYQIMYETLIPISNKTELEQEAWEVLNYIAGRLDSDYKTIYVQAEEPYSSNGGMKMGKSGVDFRFSKKSGSWELKKTN
jgi:hypothetical protein